nr:hypothetical protein [Tanacetum cinerariifolium]
MQTIEDEVDTSKALDASSGTESRKQDTSSSLGNYVDANDADIKPIYDKVPIAEEGRNLDLIAGTPFNLKKRRIKSWIKENVIFGRPRDISGFDIRWRDTPRRQCMILRIDSRLSLGDRLAVLRLYELDKSSPAARLEFLLGIYQRVILKALCRHQNEVNEIRAERIARVANPLALVAQQQLVYHHQNHPTHYTQNSSTISQQAATKNRGKAIANSLQPIYDQEPSMVVEDDETSKDKEIDKLMALISLSFKKIYKPTNNNLRTSSNTSRANQDNSPRINRSVGYENQRIGNVAGAKETVAYHREKMLLCKQEEAVIQLNANQVDWRDDNDDEELEDQELEAHYMYMAQLQEVSPDAADSGPIFDAEPLQKVSNDDYYNVFAIKSEHPEEEIDQDNDDNDLANERELLASLIEKLKCEIDESKNRNKFLETSNKVLVENLKGEIEDFKNKNKSLESSNNYFKEANNKLSETNNLLYTDYKKSEAELARRNSMEYASQLEIECAKKEAQIKLYKTREDKELDKVIALENKVNVLDNIVSKTELSKSKMMSKSFESLQKHAINLEIDLQQCQEKIKTDKSLIENMSKEFRKEREQYFEIQDLKAQLQDKGIVISEFKKLIEKLKGKSIDTKFEKSSVIRQSNAFKSQRPSILGKPTTFLNSFERKDFSKSKSVTQNNVSNDFSKPVTA